MVAPVQMQLEKFNKAKKDALASHFYRAIKASLEDPEFQRRFKEWQIKEAPVCKMTDK